MVRHRGRRPGLPVAPGDRDLPESSRRWGWVNTTSEPFPTPRLLPFVEPGDFCRVVTRLSSPIKVYRYTVLSSVQDVRRTDLQWGLPNSLEIYRQKRKRVCAWKDSGLLHDFPDVPL